MPRRRFTVCKVICFDEQKISALKKQLPPSKELESAARRHKALGHPVRQAIVHVLGIDACCVCDLANILGKPVSTVSQHLRDLMSAGFLRSRQDGKLVFYFLAPEALGPTQGKGLVVVEAAKATET